MEEPLLTIRPHKGKAVLSAMLFAVPYVVFGLVLFRMLPEQFKFMSAIALLGYVPILAPLLRDAYKSEIKCFSSHLEGRLQAKILFKVSNSFLTKISISYDTITDVRATRGPLDFMVGAGSIEIVSNKQEVMPVFGKVSHSWFPWRITKVADSQQRCRELLDLVNIHRAKTVSSAQN